MYALLLSLSTFLQPEATSGNAPTGAPANPGLAGGLTSLALPILMMVFLYLFLIRPQQKRQRETEALLKQLKKGQKVRTTSGIRGEIVDFKSEAGDEVVLLIADRVKVNILRSHIAGLVEGGSAAATEESKS